MKGWWRRQRKHFLGGLVFLVARLIGLTIRLRVIGREPKEGVGAIFVGWHGKSFIPANHFAGKGVWALFSLSNDGELQSKIFKKFGFRVIRGSTGRGGARALIESIRVLREGGRMAITPDGPRGPAGVVQPGIMAMAQKSGAALVPVGTGANPCARLGTWDRYMVPWLGARAAIVFGEPIYVPAGAGAEEVEAIRLQVQAAIAEADAAAERAVGNEPVAFPPPRPGVAAAGDEETDEEQVEESLGEGDSAAIRTQM